MSVRRFWLGLAAAAFATAGASSGASATVYVTTYTGVVLSGNDVLGAFGGGDLTGAAYVAQFVADFNPATLVTNTGNAIAVGGTPSSTPILATLAINNHSVGFTSSYSGLYGLASEDPTYGNGVSLQVIEGLFAGLDNEVENFDSLNPILNSQFITPITYKVQPSDTSFGAFGFGPVENGLLQPLTIDVAAVPEPSVWSLMIVGLGFVGAALRSGRRQFGLQYARSV